MTGRSHNAILVTDGNHRAALAVVRALGRAGLSVVAGECRGGSLAGSSRYCAETIRYPSPWEAPREFEDFLRRELSTGKYEMLLPITDVTMQSAARIRDTLSSRCCFPFPAAETLELVQDKRHMLLAARRVGLAVPETLMLSEGVEDAAQRVTYPAVIKPRFSCFFREGLWTRGAVRYALGPQD